MHTLRLGTGLLLAEVASSSTEATGPLRIHGAAAAQPGPENPLAARSAVHVQPKWVVTHPETAVHVKPKRLFTSLRNDRSFSAVVHNIRDARARRAGRRMTAGPH